MSADSSNAPYNPYYDLETGVQQDMIHTIRSKSSSSTRLLVSSSRLMRHDT